MDSTKWTELFVELTDAEAVGMEGSLFFLLTTSSSISNQQVTWRTLIFLAGDLKPVFSQALQELEKTLENPLTARRSNQSILKEINSEYSLEGLMPPDVKGQRSGKDPGAGKDWRQEEKGATEDEMVGQHHRLNGHDSEQAPGDGEGQGGLVCCSPWSHSLTWLKQLSTAQHTAQVTVSEILWWLFIHQVVCLSYSDVVIAFKFPWLQCQTLPDFHLSTFFFQKPGILKLHQALDTSPTLFLKGWPWFGKEGDKPNGLIISVLLLPLFVIKLHASDPVLKIRCVPWIGNKVATYQSVLII